ncbi:FtsK/SpoIIIE domain-containing protein [Streptomyces sp. NPDC092369]|uniref:FtsK/SpoIIIE domain-containing protein n=1 Tax=Streptomyces sp. NPDC092369 TaxID=3366015 RepID=UPI0037FE630C
MRLTLTVVDPRDGNSADVVLDADPASPVGEVAHALERVLLGGGSGDRGEGGDRTAPVVHVDGLVVDAATPLARSPLTEGCVVSLHTPAGCPPREVTGIVELRVIGGPDAGAVHRLGLGHTDIGRGAEAHVCIDDPELAELALTLTVGADGGCTVRGRDADALAVLDGVRLRESGVWPLDGQLAVGGTLLELVACVPSDGAPRRSEDGRGFVFERPPRAASPKSVRRDPVDTRTHSARLRALRRRRITFQAPMVLVLVVAVVCWALLRDWYLLLPGVLSALAATAGGYYFSSQVRVQEEAEALQDELRVELVRQRRAAPSPGAVLSLAADPRAGLWERRPGDRDHLQLRVGTGLVKGTGDSPVTLPLRRLGVIGVAGPGDSPRALGRWAVAQIAALHSPLDVRVCVLTERDAQESWDWLRWLPHARPVGGADANTALGMDSETVGVRIAELVSLLHARKRARGSGDNAHAPAPDVVVVFDGARRLRAMPGTTLLMHEGPALGIHVLCLEEDELFLPGECQATVVAEHREPTGRSALRLRVESTDSSRVDDVRPDFVSPAWCAQLARSLAPLQAVREEFDPAVLPDRSRLLDVLDLASPTGSAVAERWTSRAPSTVAVIGETYDGPFGIDLRRDGPHALIAGTTGSGKSELLQTIVASLALANSPEHLTFVLIDYKGGAAFKSCVRLPHTVGTVTELDPYLVQRLLDSLAAELRRREGLLARADAKDIEDYHDLRRRDPGDREPLPRLVVVIDEFAAMVRDLPDFISGVVNLAQRGRSLGVHLVLATQRPSGVVSAEIRANTNLSIALRVADPGESLDIVGSPEAATIPKSTPGRAYARLGQASLIPFQSARVGELRPSDQDTALRAPWVAPLTWTDLGRTLAAPARHSDWGAGATTDLDVLVDAVREANATLGIQPRFAPWLPPLPEVLSLDEAEYGTADEDAERRPGGLSPVAFGAEDLPAQQLRRPVRIDFARFGHVLIGGAPRSGRSQVLRTIAGALAGAHSCADVHIYGIDCGNRGLAALTALPHCGAVTTRRETERVDRLITRLTDELARRQDELDAQGFVDIGEQRDGVEPARRLPYLFVLLDSWEGWTSTLGEYEHGRLTDELLTLMREGASVGICVVITGDRQLLAGRISTLTEDKYALRLTDRADYAMIGVSSRKVPEWMPPGRALRAELGTETQFALLTEDPSDQSQAEALAAIGRATTVRDAEVPRERRPFAVAALPDRISFDEAWRLRDREGSCSRRWTLSAVGGDELTGYGPDLAVGVPAFVVAGPQRSGRSTALLTMARAGLKQGARLVVATPLPSPLRELAVQEGVLALFTGAELRAGAVEEAVASASPERPIVVIVDDAEILHDCDAAPSLRDLIQYGSARGLALVLGGDEDKVCAGFSGWQVEAAKARRGLLLSPQQTSSGEHIGHRIFRSSTGHPVQPGKGLLHLGDGKLLSVRVPSASEAQTPL